MINVFQNDEYLAEFENFSDAELFIEAKSRRVATQLREEGNAFIRIESFGGEQSDYFEVSVSDAPGHIAEVFFAGYSDDDELFDVVDDEEPFHAPRLEDIAATVNTANVFAEFGFDVPNSVSLGKEIDTDLELFRRLGGV